MNAIEGKIYLVAVIGYISVKCVLFFVWASMAGGKDIGWCMALAGLGKWWGW